MVSESGADESALFKSFGELIPFDPKVAKIMLKESKEILDLLGVKFFLRQGTCLGAVRDQAFIPWDDDLDLGCVIGFNGFTEEMIEPILDAFREHGYYVSVGNDDRWVAAEMIKSSLRVDLTFFRIVNDCIFHFPLNWIPAHLFSDLKEIEFMGEQYLVPNPPEDYLMAKYGPNWVTPKEDYERDVLDQVTIPSADQSASAQNLVSTKFRIRDLNEQSVQGAEVSVIGLGEALTDDNGYVELGLPNKTFYAVVIKFGDHEEILYQELLDPGLSYVYTPDAAKNNGRFMVLIEEA
jgi:hypothetical protein